MRSPKRGAELMPRFRSLSLICASAIFLLAPQFATALDKVVLATNWKAQPELGGFYQALADGTYKKYGLDVTIRPGGPLVNNRVLLPTGRVDFLVGTNLLQPFDAAKQGIPTQVVAAMFQKDPQCIIAHPDSGYAKWDDLKKAPLLMGNSGRFSFFVWMKAAHGFNERNLRPYNHNLAPFLTNKSAVQQGYATAEPKRVEEVLGREPLVFLLADHGWNSYSTVIETRTDLIEKNPDLVQRFVDASIVGWYNYLYGDNSKGNERIKRENSEMTDGQIAYSLRKLRDQGLIDSGESLEKGIGAINPDRVRKFYEDMVRSGLFGKSDLTPAEAVTTKFVNKGVGLELKPKTAPSRR